VKVVWPSARRPERDLARHGTSFLHPPLFILQSSATVRRPATERGRRVPARFPADGPRDWLSTEEPAWAFKRLTALEEKIKKAREAPEAQNSGPEAACRVRSGSFREKTFPCFWRAGSEPRVRHSVAGSCTESRSPRPLISRGPSELVSFGAGGVSKYCVGQLVQEGAEQRSILVACPGIHWSSVTAPPSRHKHVFTLPVATRTTAAVLSASLVGLGLKFLSEHVRIDLAISPGKFVGAQSFLDLPSERIMPVHDRDTRVEDQRAVGASRSSASWRMRTERAAPSFPPPCR